MKKKSFDIEKLELINLAEAAISEILEDIDSVTVNNSQKSRGQKSNSISKDSVNKFHEEMEDQLRESRERILRLKDLSIRLRNENVHKMEDTPAYKRKELVLTSESGNTNSGANFHDKTKAFNITFSGFDAIKLARSGFAKSELITFAKEMSLTIPELANVMHISERTLQRYDDNEVVRAEYSEKVVELARLYNRGEEVFDSIEKFKLWMKSPSFVFNGETPISLLDTSAGFDVVFKELGRIEHGIFA